MDLTSHVSISLQHVIFTCQLISCCCVCCVLCVLYINPSHPPQILSQPHTHNNSNNTTLHRTSKTAIPTLHQPTTRAPTSRSAAMVGCIKRMTALLLFITFFTFLSTSVALAEDGSPPVSNRVPKSHMVCTNTCPGHCRMR